MSQIQELFDADFKASIKNQKLSIVDVYATWCGSCKLFAPEFEAIAAQFPQYSFFKIEAEKNPEFAATLDMDNLPFIAVYHEGEFVGGKSTSKRQVLEEMIAKIQSKLGA